VSEVLVTLTYERRQPSGKEERCPMNISVVGIRDEVASEGVVICVTTISAL
jgi:hypothetical protein